MQHVENDMDDLFQRAAENYPLNAGDGDWQNIARQIADKPLQDIVAGKKRERKRRWPFLFLLFFVLPIGRLIIRQDTSPLSPVIADRVAVQKDKAFEPAATITALNIASGLKKAAVFSNEDAFSSSGKNIYKTNSKTLMQVYQAGSDDMQRQNNEPEILIEKLPGMQMEISKYKRALTATTTISQNLLPGILQKKDTPVVNSRIQNKSKNSLDLKRFYAGVIAGPDFSRVKSMAFSSTGNIVGLIAGYRINKHVSVETGIGWNKKYYESEGVSFNMDRVRTSMAGMTIANLSGQSSLIEIPVKVKYDWSKKTNVNFFVTGGFSAYVMTHEKNRYNVTMNGNQQKLTGIYDHNNYGLPAVASFSIGYEHNISQGLQIRVEPVLKVPLRGMGIGSLPITSTGLQIGLIRRLK